jgi:hypothetical protein
MVQWPEDTDTELSTCYEADEEKSIQWLLT